MSMLSAGLKKVRKTLHLPPVNLKNVATKYAPVALTVASLGGAGPLAGIAGKVGSVASKLPGAAKVAGLAKGAGSIYNTLSGHGASGSIDPEGDTLYGTDTTPSGASSAPGGITDILHKIRKAAGLPPITLKNTLGGVAGAAGGVLRTALDNPLETIGGIAAAKSGAEAMKRSRDLSDKAIGVKEKSYAEREGLRKLGVSGMSKLTAAPKQEYVNRANPFAKKRTGLP